MLDVASGITYQFARSLHRNLILILMPDFLGHRFDRCHLVLLLACGFLLLLVGRLQVTKYKASRINGNTSYKVFSDLEVPRLNEESSQDIVSLVHYLNTTPIVWVSSGKYGYVLVNMGKIYSNLLPLRHQV